MRVLESWPFSEEWAMTQRVFAAAEDGGVGLAVAVVVLRDRRNVGVAGEARRGGGSPGGKVDENLPVPGR
jgi:hypothetical protein